MIYNRNTNRYSNEFVKQEEIPCSKKVFELRRNGNLNDALILGRECYEKNKEDEWTAKALGWVLYDLVRQYKDSNNLSSAREALTELSSLNIKDDVLTPKIQYLSNQLNPERQILLLAKKASQDKNQKEALKLYRDAVSLLPNDEEANKGLGWCLSHELKELVSNENPDTALIRKILVEYSKLKFTKPDLLHSIILQYIVKISDKYPKYIEFIKWWDVNNFRNEDLQEEYDHSKQTHYKSLAEKVAFTISEMIEEKKLVDEVDFAIDIIDRILNEGQYKNKVEINSYDSDIPF